MYADRVAGALDYGLLLFISMSCGNSNTGRSSKIWKWCLGTRGWPADVLSGFGIAHGGFLNLHNRLHHHETA